MKKLILWCVALMLLLVACSPSLPSIPTFEVPLPGATPTTTAPTNGEPSPEASPVPPPPQIPTSEDLIAQALEAGEIDYETSLLYRTYAIFGDPRLPEEFLSLLINIDAGTALFSEIFANQEQLSAETLEALAPFLARPNDPISIFNQDLAYSTSGLAKPSLFAPRQAPSWQSKAAVGGAIRVWVRSDRDASALLEIYAEEVDQIWAAGRNLIGAPIADSGKPSSNINPDSAIDVYFVPLGSTDPRRQSCLENPAIPSCTFAGALGWAQRVPPFSANSSGAITSSGYVVIDASLSGHLLIGTIAHELFHVSQFAYDYNETSWLSESTATWGEFRVLQELGRGLDSVHDYLPGFFYDLDSTPLFSTIYTHEYGAYLYSLFAQMEEGDAIVRAFWEEASAQGQQGLTAIDRVFPFRDHFHEFALRNWNQNPVTPRYKPEGDREFPGLAPPVKDELTLVPDQSEILEIELLPVTASYYAVTVGDENIGTVTIDLGDITGQSAAGVDAIVTIAGKEPEVRHWSDQPEVIFCMTEPEQKLQELILIVSNARIAQTAAELSSQALEGTIGIWPSTEPCSGWIGMITYSRTWNIDEREPAPEGGTLFEQGSETLKIQITIEGSETGESPDPDQPAYNLRGHASVTYQLNHSHGVEGGDCHLIYGVEKYAQASGPVGVGLRFFGNGEYSIATSDVPVAEGQHQGTVDSCADEYDELYSESFTYSVGFIDAHGTVDPTDPNVLSGRTETSATVPTTLGTVTTVTTTITWSLRRY